MNNTLDYVLWDPGLELFKIFGISIRYYSLCWVIGLAFAYFIVKKLYKQQNVEQKLFDPLFFYCFFGILIGARLGHCLFYEPAYYLSHPLEMILPFANTATGWKYTGFQGLASHGGTIGLMIALWLYVRKTKLSIWMVLDNIAIATPLTACFIRLGNLMNSEILGKVTDVPWAFIFVREGAEPRHPAQLYEAIAYLIIFFVGWSLYRKFKKRVGSGFFFGFCLTTIFSFRFFIEFLKEIQVDFESTMSLDMGQWLSIPFIALGIFCMIRGWRKGEITYKKVNNKKH